MKTTRLVKQLNNWFLDVIPKEFDMTKREYRKRPLLYARVNPDDSEAVDVNVMVNPGSSMVSTFKPKAADGQSLNTLQFNLISEVGNGLSFALSTLADSVAEPDTLYSNTLASSAIMFRLLMGLLHNCQSLNPLERVLAVLSSDLALGTGLNSDSGIDYDAIYPYEDNAQYLLDFLAKMTFAQEDDSDSDWSQIVQVTDDDSNLNKEELTAAILDEVMPMPFDSLDIKLVFMLTIRQVMSALSLQEEFEDFLDVLAGDEPEDLVPYEKVLGVLINWTVSTVPHFVGQLMADMDPKYMMEHFETPVW